jgi:hypothetical protein
MLMQNWQDWQEKWWFRFRFGKSRWWATSVVVAIAMWATPMNPIIHGFIAFFAWILGGILFAISITWDYARWHWPFLSMRLQRQIEKGDDIKARAAASEVKEWRDETLKIIVALWGYESDQWRDFSSEVVAHQPNPLVPLDNLLSMLKKMDPR